MRLVFTDRLAIGFIWFIASFFFPHAKVNVWHDLFVAYTHIHIRRHARYINNTRSHSYVIACVTASKRSYLVSIDGRCPTLIGVTAGRICFRVVNIEHFLRPILQTFLQCIFFIKKIKLFFLKNMNLVVLPLKCMSCWCAAYRCTTYMTQFLMKII